MTLSLRTRLVVGIAVLLTCGLLVADVSGVVLLRSYLLHRRDHEARRQLLARGGTARRRGPARILGTTIGPVARALQLLVQALEQHAAALAAFALA